MDDEFVRIDEAIEHFNGASREELMSYLAGGDEILIQIGLLNLSEINSTAEAESIINALTEHSSETREYCAFLINRLMKNGVFAEFFVGDKVLDKFSKAVSDVNPKVCRKIIEILPYYREINKLFPILIKNSFEFISGLQEKNKNKNYQYNTLSFRLYWTIFALVYAIDKNFINEYEKELLVLIERLSEFKEYTIREKTAVLVQKINSIKEIPAITEHLQAYFHDENFFVKEIVS